MHTKRRIPVLALSALALLLAMAPAGCRPRSSAAASAGFTAPATVSRGSISDVVQVGGQVLAVNSKTLTFGTVGGRVVEVKVRPGQQVKKGDALVLIDPLPQDRALREAQADLKVAEVALADAQRTASAADLASAQAALHAAQASQAAAQADLTVAQQAATQLLQEAVDDAQGALLDTQDNLKQTEASSNQTTIRNLEYELAFFQRALRDLKPDEDPSEKQNALTSVERQLASARSAREQALRSASDAVSKAQQTLTDAQAALARAKAGQDDPTTSARLALQKATANVDKAQKALDQVQAGADSEAVKNAKTAYDAAQARVNTAQTNLRSSTLAAPFDGVVFNVYVTVDQYVQANTNIVFLADPSELRVRAQVSELDVTQLQVGQPVRLTFDALRNQTFAGELITLPASGTASGGLTTYTIETSLQKGGADIRTGMLANVRILVGEKNNVLTIPSAAVQRHADNTPYAVVRDANGRTHEQTIEVGIDDGVLTEVRSGLKEGQVVLMPLVAPGSSGRSATAAPTRGQGTPAAPTQGTPAADRTPEAPGQITPPANWTPGAQGRPGMNQTPGAQFTPPADWTPGAQGRPGANQTPGAQFTPPANWTPGTQGRPGTNQTPGAQATRPAGNPSPTPKPATQAQIISASRGL